MGNYNCQECITKEANFINELLLDINLLSPNEPSSEEPKIYESKIKQKKSNKTQPSQEDIKKILENEELSLDQKKFVEKIIKKNSVDIYLKNNEKQEKQNKIIEKQKEIDNKKENDKNNNENIPEVKITTLEPNSEEAIVPYMSKYNEQNL